MFNLPVVGKSLQMNNQHLRKGPQVKLLGGLLMLLTGGAVPTAVLLAGFIVFACFSFHIFQLNSELVHFNQA